MTTARELVFDAEQRFVDAGLVFGHGTDNARDEAVLLVFHALELAFDVAETELDKEVEQIYRDRAEQLLITRIETRQPAAYLIGHMWFAGHQFEVDERVLVPRSPIAELINQAFSPWLALDSLDRILEIGTGSGCIAIATAAVAHQAQVVATDISPAALAVANRNLARFPDVAERVRFLEADLFPEGNAKFDLIITNPPYVPSDIVVGLPPEYQCEPSIALDAGPDGLSLLRRICSHARERLTEHGALIVDVGEMATAVDIEIPGVNFTWIDLQFGGAGIGIAYRRDFLG